MKNEKMPNNENIKEMLHQALQKAFQTLPQVEPFYAGTLSEEELKENPSPFYRLGIKDPVIIGVVGLAGDMAGALCLYLERPLAAALAAAMTGIPARDAAVSANAGLMKDLVWELVNLTAGHLRKSLTEYGTDCRLALPMVWQGVQLAVESSRSSRRFAFGFEALEKKFAVDLFLENPE